MQRRLSQDVDLASLVEAIAQRGWATTVPVIDEPTVRALRDTIEPLAIDRRGGARNLLADESIRSLAASSVVRRFACAVLGQHCFAVRALLFDKTPKANWKVAWHQDLTIATRERIAMPGYGPWSEKAGVPHVQPPVSVLEHMLAVRVHLDPYGLENGPVRVIDGSHLLGRLSPIAIDVLRSREPTRECLVAQGGLLVFRPLILHSSAPASKAAHRRVIHVEFASRALPEPLEWYERIA
jgi:ectoine hydroxylase-related dioxygenase (phytanoyl-CoA dioxygenase family)